MDIALFVGKLVLVKLSAHLAEFAPALVACDDEKPFAKAAFELRADVIEALGRRLTGEFHLIAAKVDGALALPGGCLDLAELLLAAQRLDGLVENGLRVLGIIRPCRTT